MAPCGHSEALVTLAEQTVRGGWPGSWKEGVPSGGGPPSSDPRVAVFTDGLEGAGAGRGVCTLESVIQCRSSCSTGINACRAVQAAGGTPGGCPASAEKPGEVPQRKQLVMN